MAQPAGQQQQQIKQGHQEEQKCVIRVACESSDCGALLEVPIHDELRRQAPPQLVIRCANCRRLLSVNLPPETYASLTPVAPSGESLQQNQGVGTQANSPAYSQQAQIALIKRQQEQIAMLQMLQQQIAAQQSQLQSLGILTPGGNITSQTTGGAGMGMQNMGSFGVRDQQNPVNTMGNFGSIGYPSLGGSGTHPHASAMGIQQQQQNFAGSIGQTAHLTGMQQIGSTGTVQQASQLLQARNSQVPQMPGSYANQTMHGLADAVQRQMGHQVQSNVSLAATPGGKPQQRRRKNNEDSAEEKRTPSEYHKFLQDECKRLKSSNPEMPPEERLITAARKVSPGNEGMGTDPKVQLQDTTAGSDQDKIGAGGSDNLGEIGGKQESLHTPMVTASMPRGGDLTDSIKKHLGKTE